MASGSNGDSTSGSRSSHTWIGRLVNGDAEAAQRLWEDYFPQLALLAQRKLAGTPRRMADEEDIALSAMNSFCLAARDGRFPQLTDPDDLWKLLITITTRKALRYAEHARRRKRGGGRVRGESAFYRQGDAEAMRGLDEVAGAEPTPEFAAEFADELQRLLERLGDDQLRTLALLKLEGYSNQEIAQRLECGLRTVERRLRGIRSIWSEEPIP